MAGFFDRFRVPEPTRRELDRPGYEEALGHIRDGRRIHAIKVVREHTGMGLVEAKKLAEDIEAGRWSRPGPRTVRASPTGPASCWLGTVSPTPS